MNYFKDFPILSTKMNGKPLVYLDNGATTQKPERVLKAIDVFYRSENANVHRGVYTLSQNATKMYESAREVVQSFVHAKTSKEIIFTRGTTESINLVAQSYGRNSLKSGEEVLISEMEHHSNIVPWQILCEQTGAKLIVIPITSEGKLDLDEFEKKLSSKTKILSIVHVSNTLGTINPIKELIRKAKTKGAITLVDGAQAVQHLPVDVQDLDCDFYAFSGHKIYGPTGIGVLYGRESLLNKMPPYQSGGDMILSVSFEKTVYNELPHKFEAGTPHIAGVVGLAESIKYVKELGFNRIQETESRLLSYATKKLKEISRVKIIGEAKEKSSVISFVVEGVHPHDVGTILDQEGIAIRAGHHCTQPIMEKFKIPATVRASFSFYNTENDVDALIRGIKKALEIFK